MTSRDAQQQSLFDSTDTWRQKPLEAFSAFVQSPSFVKLGRRSAEFASHSDHPPPIRTNSARIYILMFSKFARWMVSNQKTIFCLSSEDIIRFLDYDERSDRGTKDLNSAIRIRYLRILERVFAHLKVQPNPARSAAFSLYERGDAVGKDLGKVLLTDSQHAAFMAALPEAPEGVSSKDPHHGWKRRRDRAMQAMMLGAGLKVSEVIGLHTMSVGVTQDNGSVPVTISTTSAVLSRPHRTQLRPFAVAEVKAWMRERKKMKIPGPLLFPATVNGGELNKATVYRQVKATFARAGIDVQRRGGRTLRNSFAVRELQVESVDLVGEFLGHRIRKSTLKYLPGPSRTTIGEKSKTNKSSTGR